MVLCLSFLTLPAYSYTGLDKCLYIIYKRTTQICSTACLRSWLISIILSYCNTGDGKSAIACRSISLSSCCSSIKNCVCAYTTEQIDSYYCICAPCVFIAVNTINVISKVAAGVFGCVRESRIISKSISIPFAYIGRALCIVFLIKTCKSDVLDAVCCYLDVVDLNETLRKESIAGSICVVDR